MSLMYLILGLLIFLGVHSTRVFANDWRNQTLARMGEKPFKGIYALLSLAGFVLLVWGYGQSRQMGVMLWNPPVAMSHIAALLTLVAFVLLTAAYVPGNQIKAKLHHPWCWAPKSGRWRTCWPMGHWPTQCCSAAFCCGRFCCLPHHAGATGSSKLFMHPAT